MTRFHAAVKFLSTVALAALLASPALARHRHHRSDDGYQRPAEQSEQAPQERAPAERQSAHNNEAGQFDYYALVLSWSPSFCADGGHADSPQCASSAPRPYNFVLHGLWPQYQKGWPQNCPTDASPFVPNRLINQMLDIMPARQLVIHEYKKHGTCSGLDPEGYFALARRLYTSIQIPQRFQNPEVTQSVSPDEVLAEFEKINPELKPDMIAVSCGGGGNRLKEVHICMSRDGKPAACGRNEVQRKMCDASTMFVPPVRGAAGTAAGWSPGQPTAGANAPKQTLGGAILHYFGKK
jgi:ribonuclease T2